MEVVLKNGYTQQKRLEFSLGKCLKFIGTSVSSVNLRIQLFKKPSSLSGLTRLSHRLWHQTGFVFMHFQRSPPPGSFPPPLESQDAPYAAPSPPPPTLIWDRAERKDQNI